MKNVFHSFLAEQVLHAAGPHGVPEPAGPGREAHQVPPELHREGGDGREGRPPHRGPVHRRDGGLRQGD